MKKLFYYANEYLQRCSWKDLALLKLCLFAIGLFAGTALPQKYRRVWQCFAIVAFVASYIPLMVKFFSTIQSCKQQEEDGYEILSKTDWQ